MAGAVWCHVSHPTAKQSRLKDAPEPVAVADTSASWPWKHPMGLSLSVWAYRVPLEQHLAQHRRQRDLARSRLRLGQVDEDAVALLHAADGDDAALEIDILPQHCQLLGRPSAGEERPSVVKTEWVLFGHSEQQPYLGWR